MDIEKSSKRRSSDLLMQDALREKAGDLEKFNVELYKPLTTVSLDQTRVTQRNLIIENRILDVFIVFFTIFIVFELSLLGVLKIENLNLNFNTWFNYGYLSVLVFGKLLNVICLLTFAMRCYVGVKLFKSSDSNLLTKVLNVQFQGFLSNVAWVFGLLLVNYTFRMALASLDLVNMQLEQLGPLNTWLDYSDALLYVVVVAGILLSGMRHIVKIVTR